MDVSLGPVFAIGRAGVNRVRRRFGWRPTEEKILDEAERGATATEEVARNTEAMLQELRAAEQRRLLADAPRFEISQGMTGSVTSDGPTFVLERPSRAARGDQSNDQLWPCGGHPVFSRPTQRTQEPRLMTSEHDEAPLPERVCKSDLS
jgi:hypothetical protein